MYSYKKDNNNKDKSRNNNSKYKGKKFNIKLATYIKATIIRYKY